MDLIRLETYSENNRLLDKIANLVVDQKVALFSSITAMNMVYIEKGSKRRVSGYKLIILTKPEYKSSVIRVILDNHNEEDPKITIGEVTAATLATEEWMSENF